ncbi:hypothetical protein D3C87_1353200 [compost metagenome]
MTACAAAGVAGTEADQEAGDQNLAPARLNIGRCRVTEQAAQDRGADQPDEEGHAPSHVMARQAEQAPKDAADACNPAVEQDEHGSGCANDEPSGQRQTGGEVS